MILDAEASATAAASAQRLTFRRSPRWYICLVRFGVALLQMVGVVDAFATLRASGHARQFRTALFRYRYYARLGDARHSAKTAAN